MLEMKDSTTQTVYEVRRTVAGFKWGDQVTASDELDAALTMARGDLTAVASPYPGLHLFRDSYNNALIGVWEPEAEQ
jgi:hypothetical protein